MTHPAGPVIRGSWGDLLLRTKLGGRERREPCANNDTETFWVASRPQCISQAQGLNAQAKGEVQILIRGRGGAIQAKEEVLISGRGAIEIFSFGSYMGKQELGGIRVWSGHQWWLRAGTFCGCSWNGAWWPAFDPLFFGGGGGGPIQRSRVVLIAPNSVRDSRMAGWLSSVTVWTQHSMLTSQWIRSLEGRPVLPCSHV
jgi:hypothetical protein